MKTLKYLTCIYILFFSTEIFSQDQSILVYDPNEVSSSFQYTLSQLTEDTVFVANTIDENINNFDALFLFLGYPHVLTNEEGDKLISFTGNHKPIYIYSKLGEQNIDSVDFWNYIGITSIEGLLVSVLVDSVTGVDSGFTQNVVIDTSFMSGYIPIVSGDVDSILIGRADGWEVNTTFRSSNDSLSVIVDLYNLIDDYGFLQSVLEYFKLIPPMDVNEDFNSIYNFKLLQNYPNPFNPTTRLQYTISSVQFVSLKVFDILGKEVKTLVNEEKPKGEYETEFNGSGLPSGIYFYTLRAGEFVQTKKMMLIK